MPSPLDRRQFLSTAAAGAALTTLPSSTPLWATPVADLSAPATPESLVKLLYESFTPKQRETVCFAWDQAGPDGGPLRRHVSNNWQITDPALNDDFYTGEQRELVRAIFEGIYNPDWHERIDRQLKDDAGGFGESNSIAIFGEPGSDRCEFVMTGRHMTVRCDGNTTPHFAFGGPIFYGHDADGFYERPNHPGSVFWPQGVAANELYQMLDGEQREAALVRTGLPRERKVHFRPTGYQGIPVAELSGDQQQHLRGVLNKLVEPYRTADQQEALDCLAGQQHAGHTGMEACHLAYYAEGDLGDDACMHHTGNLGTYALLAAKYNIAVPVCANTIRFNHTPAMIEVTLYQRIPFCNGQFNGASMGKDIALIRDRVAITRDRVNIRLIQLHLQQTITMKINRKTIGRRQLRRTKMRDDRALITNMWSQQTNRAMIAAKGPLINNGSVRTTRVMKPITPLQKILIIQIRRRR